MRKETKTRDEYTSKGTTQLWLPGMTLMSKRPNYMQRDLHKRPIQKRHNYMKRDLHTRPIN